MFVLAIAPRLEATSIRLERDPVGTRERPWAEPAVARCLLDESVVHPVPSERGDPHDLKPSHNALQRVISALEASSRLANEPIQAERSQRLGIPVHHRASLLDDRTDRCRLNHCPRP